MRQVDKINDGWINLGRYTNVSIIEITVNNNTVKT